MEREDRQEPPRKDPQTTHGSCCPAEAAYVAAGMFLFGLCIHSRDGQIFLSLAGLAIAAFTIFRFIFRHPDGALQTLGFSSLSRISALFVALGSAAGIGFGNIYRLYCGQAAFPGRLGGFVPVACLIGATEELVYRGFIQGLLRPSGRAQAIICSSLFHTLYKCSLFMTFPMHGDIDLRLLGLFTFLAGLVFGKLREDSGSVLPPLAAHAFFDLIVYGEYGAAPWWVWS